MIIKVFRETARRYSERIALESGEKAITYGQLEAITDRAAAGIGAELPGGKGRGRAVAALLFEHGIDMIIGMIAALKARLVYVPLDRTYPDKRLEYILKDSEALLILTNSKNFARAERLVENSGSPITIIDIHAPGGAGAAPGSTIEGILRSPSIREPAYILYTSGSTGKPKGVIQNHENVLYYTRNWQERYTITHRDRMTLVTSLTHDGAEQDIWGAMHSGAALYPYDIKDVTAGTQLTEYLQKEEITIWHSVPTLYRYLVSTLETEAREKTAPPMKFPRLRWILLGGEPIRQQDIQLYKKYFPGANLANVYGQTESSVSTIAVYTAGDSFEKPVLGKPLDKTEIFLVNDEDEIVEGMGIGEIVVASEHIAPGYWKDPGKEKSPFTQDPEMGKLYWTGDLGMRKADGEIEILGRKDHQIKIRGYRVETGEIETVLLRQEAIKEAVVTREETRENEPYLCCYYTAGKPLDPGQLRQELLRQLPDYMVPGIFMRVEKFPLTPSGKIDRKALPEPGPGENPKEKQPLETQIERSLAGLWGEVLNIETPLELLGREDNFFEKGGHSLRAIRLIARVQKEFQVKLELEEVFANPVLREMARQVEQKTKEAVRALQPSEKKQYYPLSSPQQRLYFLRQMDPGGTGYNLSNLMEMEGKLEKARVEETLRKLVQRHESMRTSFEMVGSRPVQRVHEAVPVEIEYYIAAGAAGAAAASGEQGEKEYIIKHFVRPFDLERAPLYRVGVLRLEENRHVIMMDLHHIIADGTSLAVIGEEFNRWYAGEKLPPLKLQYKDYAQWQRGEIAGGRLKHQEAYWLKEFAGDIPVLELPIDHPRPLNWDFEGDNERYLLEAGGTGRLKQLAQRENATLYMVLLAVMEILLSKMSGQEDIVMGTPVEGRRHTDLEGMIGMFVNTLALRNYPRGEKTFTGFLKEVREKTISAFENQEYPFEELVDRLAVTRDISRNPLFDVVLALHNESTLPPDKKKLLETGTYATIPFRHNRARFDLAFQAIETGDLLACSLEYSTKLFKKETIRRYTRYWRAIVAAVSENPDVKLSEINILTDREIRQLLQEMNCTEAQYPLNKTLDGLFHDQVERTPDRAALVGHLKDLSDQSDRSDQSDVSDSSDLSDQPYISITYLALKERSGRLAAILQEKGVRPDTVVGIMLERSIEMIIGILGILKAGGAYMPIDPGYPGERKRYMLKDSGAKVLLTGESNFNCRLPIVNCQLSTLTLTSTLTCQVGPANLAYIIYTSGTTGRPKGVMVRHRNVVRLMVNSAFPFEINEGDVWTMIHSYCFDFSVWEMYGAMLYGGKLIIVPRDTAKDTPAVLEMLKREKVTVFNQTPSAFYRLMEEELKAPGKELGMKYIIFGGEALKPSKLKAWKQRYPGTRLINMYGITETTVHVTYKEIAGSDLESPASCIGKPIPTLTVYVMDRNSKLQPMGVPGELWVGGEGVARGYMNQPALTSEKFKIINYKLKIKNGSGALRAHLNAFGEATTHHSPLTTHHSPLYRTGDLIKWQSKGELEYLGRIDEQVKIRGYRIEPGEIEARVLAYPQGKIKAVVLVPREDREGNRYLCGYLEAGEEIEIPGLKKYLAGELPEYMIPPFFYQVKEIPLTATGKVDKKALPEPVITGRKDRYTSPGNEVEEQLVGIWSEVLGIDRSEIGTGDNFFEMGGHSLNAVRVVALVHKVFQIRIPLPEFFRNPDIKGIARNVQRAAEERYTAIEKVEPREYYPLSSAQERLYVLQQMEEESTLYNMPLIIPIGGEMSREKLEQVFRELIARHESMRTSFQMVDEKPVQVIHEKVEFQPEVFGSPEPFFQKGFWPPEAIIKDFIRSFDLARAPLLRVGLIETTGHGILLVDMHHIISDGISLRILEREFNVLYSGRKLPAPRLQYKDYAVWQNRRKIRETAAKQEAYWLKVLEGEIPKLRLPYDFPRPEHRENTGGRIAFEIDKPAATGIKQLARVQGATVYMVLLAVYMYLMSRLSGQEEVIIGTPVAGRNHADLADIIGVFVNTLVIRGQLDEEQPFIDFLKEVKRNVLEAFENQEYPFEALVEKVGVRREAGGNPLFDVMFALQEGEVPPQSSLYKASPGEEPASNPLEGRVSKFDITLEAKETGDTISFQWEYAAALFEPGTIRRYAAYYQQAVTAVLRSPEQSLREIEIITEAEKHCILEVFNHPIEDILDEKNLSELFEEQEERAPDRAALVGQAKGLSYQSDQSDSSNRSYRTYINITYRQLKERSGRLAVILQEKGVRPETIVGIMEEPSVEMIIGILGILKAGGAYMPIDPGNPEERKQYMLKDSGAKLLVTTENIQSAININRSHSSYMSNRVEKIPAISLAYIIYTSGTTGRPKGVMVDHGNAAAYLKAFNREFQLTEREIVIQQAAYTFDAFFEEVYPPLMRGGRIVIPPRDRDRDVTLLAESIHRHTVTIVGCTPLVLNFLNQGNPLPTVRVFISGGEVLKGEYTGNLQKTGTVYNTYGPTETTVCATYYRCPGTVKSNVPIGKPIANYRVMIYAGNRLVPEGIPGEICISGAGVARGYLNRPELTSEKFIEDYYRSYMSNRSYRAYNKLYKTGDLGRWQSGGEIEFIGRADGQVKIRGYRIETGEIESRLLAHKGVAAAVVISRGDETGDKNLCAYIVGKEEVDPAQLREYLAQTLPGYMIPAYIIRIERIPLTFSGKVNRQALPAPAIKKSLDRQAPQDWWEEQIATAWSEVLGIPIEAVGIDENFFEGGGHSLKAALLTGKIHKRLKVKVALGEVFKTPTIRGIAGYIKKSAAKEGYTAIEPAEAKEYYAVSPTQKGIYILQQMEPGGTAYHMPLFLAMEGEPDASGLEAVIRGISRRHEALRTSFIMVKGEPVQRIHKEVEFALEYYEATEDTEEKNYKIQNTNYNSQITNKSEVVIHHEPDQDPKSQELRAKSYIKDFIRPFELAEPPLFRVGLVRQAEKKYILMMDLHHIVTDGTSMNILARDFAAMMEGKELPLLRLQYKDYSEWKNSRRQREVIARQEMYWHREFSREIPLLNLPWDYPRTAEPGNEGQSVSFSLNPRETRAVKAFVLKEGVSITMMALAVFTILAAKLSGQEDIIVGVPAAGRNYEDIHEIVGMFVNTLSIRSCPNYYRTAGEFLHIIKEKTLTAFENQEYPFEELVERLGSRIPRERGRNPLFDVMVAPQETETPVLREKQNPEPYKNPISIRKTAKFDLTLLLAETRDRLCFILAYRTRLFKEETIRRFIDYFRKILTTLLEKPQTKIGEIEIITEKEKQQILEEFNETREEYPAEKTLTQLFEEQVKRAPDRVALVGQVKDPSDLSYQSDRSDQSDQSDQPYISITYCELNERSGRLAAILQEKGVRPDMVVGIMVERSIEMIIGILGILRAGGAYMPIDPGYPEERKQYMLRDSGAKVLLSETSNTLNKSFLGVQGAIFQKSPLVAEGIKPTVLGRHPLAYIIYTSGSTGKPNGVMVEHGNAVNVVWWYGGRYRLGEDSHVLLMSDYTFDPSVNQVFGALTRGAVLYVISKKELMEIESLRRYIEKHHIHLVNFVPQWLNHLLGSGPKLKSIKAVICGGEKLDDQIKENILGRGYELYNQYGPTEATIDVTMGRCSEAGPGSVIGKPIANVGCYVVDRSGILSPIGVPGELWAAGAGIARGYLNRPELTAEKFIMPSATRNPFEKGFLDLPKLLINHHSPLTTHHSPLTTYHSPLTTHHSPLYKTGDLARWLEEGSLEFLGRMDHQVKIRGNRVELGEIETQLRRIDGIKDVVVAVHEAQTGGVGGPEPGETLCAYIVAGENIDLSKLRDELGKRLPAYMTPGFFVRLAEIPLKPNGKVDRDALPKPGLQMAKNQPGTLPRDPIEKKLAEIWAQVLFGSEKAVESIGIDDDFFSQGGNSIKALRLTTCIREEFKEEIPLDFIFGTPSIRNISAKIRLGGLRAGKEEIGVLLGTGGPGKEKIFCFPPAVGYGIAYMELAPLISGSTLYAFHYIEEEEQGRERMERYVETILEMQPEGPYRLMGYSAGGKLCLKAAEGLEKRGHQVRDIILLDCYSWRKPLAEETAEERDREFNREIEQGLKELGLETMIEKVMDRMEKYARYHGTLQLPALGSLRANIHLIKAEDKKGSGDLKGWGAYTRGEYQEYEGQGHHRDMLSAGYIDKNAAIINRILAAGPAETRAGVGFLTEEIRQAHRFLSESSVKFLEYVRQNPGALIRSNYREMIEKTGSDEMQPWPTFIDTQRQKAIEEAAITTCNLVRSIPQRLFKNDPHRMSQYYGLPVKMLETQINGVTERFLAGLIGRGDFVMTAAGCKCLEYNIAANIGGLHLATWEAHYLENPIIKKFLKENQVKIKRRDILALFLEHLVSTAQETLINMNSHLNIVIAARGNPINTLPREDTGGNGKSNEIETRLNRAYAGILDRMEKKKQGRVRYVGFDELTVRGEGLYHGEQPVQVLVETQEGAVPPEIMRLCKTRRLCLFNGPVTGLMSNKLNLALLSEHETSPVWNESEREAIKTYIPWTRKITPSETSFQGERIRLEDFIRGNREQLVMKPAVGYGGEGVAIGKNTAPEQWESVLEKALQNGKWLVQEYVPSLSFLYQGGEKGAEPHWGVWGFLVFGNRYAGGSVRILPVAGGGGVVNVRQGATASAVLEILPSATREPF